ncbi:glycosyltransferase family 4 protein [Planctomycetota bacterium]|nr:glycosyltransferase family 4 protein [Planctomycetota bacterium]
MADKLNILHITYNSNFDGGTRYIHDLSEQLVARGHKVTIAGRKTEWKSLFENKNWEWLDLTVGGNIKELISTSRAIAKYVKRNKVDVIHTHYRKASIVAKLVQLQCRVPFIFTVHLTDLPMNGIWGWLTFWGNETHCPSEQAKTWVKDVASVADERLHVIPHGIDPSEYPEATAEEQLEARRELNLPLDKTIIGYVGRLGPVKNSQWLLKFAKHFAENGLPFHLVAIGEGTERELLETSIKEQQLEDYFTLLPFGSPKLVYYGSDLMILASKREGFSLVCMEAMCSGRAVLRTNTAGCDEMIREGETGYVVPIDYEVFLSKLLEVASDLDELKRLGKNAAALVRSDLSQAVQVDKTENLYQYTVSKYGKSYGKSTRDE